MKFLILSLIIFSIFACSNEKEVVEVTKIFSMEDVASAGFKVKKDFDSEFPDSTDAKFGFYKGRDVGVIRYETLELAKSSQHTSATEQTELIEVVEKNIAYGNLKLKEQSVEELHKINLIHQMFTGKILEG